MIAAAHPGMRLELWFMDEARVGQKGRTGRRWWLRGERPRGLCDQRYASVYLFGAVRPATGDKFALVLPAVSIPTMQLFLNQFAAQLPADVHAAVVLDGAGWHASQKLVVPDNVTLVPLPPYAPELNPVERLWLHLRERFFSHCVFAGYRAIIDTCSAAWNSLSPEQLRSLTAFPWIPQVSS